MSILHASASRRTEQIDLPPAVSALLSDGLPLDLRSILNALGEVVYSWEIEPDRLIWSGDVERLLGWDRELATGEAYQQLVSEAGGPIRYDEMLRQGLLASPLAAGQAENGTAFRFRYTIETASGRFLLIEEEGRYFGDVAGLPVLAYGVLRVANAPASTLPGVLPQQSSRLLSREGLAEHLQAALRARPGRRSGLKNAPPARLPKPSSRATGFLLAGLSDLGHLNRTYGFDVADEVIDLVAERLRGALRVGDEIGRYSGNKLGIILKDCSHEHLTQAAQRFFAVIRDDEIGTRHGSIRTSIKLGGVLASQELASASEMMQSAEDALAAAKKQPHRGFVCFEADQRREEQRRINQRTSDELIGALNDRRIMLAFQPIACARSRVVKYHEGLVRMQGLDGCVRGAAQIVPPAERVGLLKHVDMRVIELAVAELSHSRNSVLSINVDGPSMIDGDWLQMLAGTLLSNRIEAGRLIIEITETAMIEDFATTSAVIHQMHDMGVRVALDDFGAGHTSFRTLRNIPIDIVKIDGVFMHDLIVSKDDRFFVKTLIDLARHLDMKTVAEWVRDEETADILTDMGIDYLQGDFIGEALFSPVSGFALPRLDGSAELTPIPLLQRKA